MKKNIITISILIIMTLSLSLLTLAGCGEGKAMTINFEDIKKEELESLYLENKTDDKMTFVESGVSPYRIAFDDEHTRSIDRAIDDLIDVVKKMSGVVLPLDNSKKEYIINIHTSNTPIEGVDDDGFVIDISHNNILISGNNMTGTRNGIYHFLEYYLGVMFLSNSDTYVPHHSNIYLKCERQIFNPATAWRDVYSYELSRNFWAQQLKINAIDMDSTDAELFTPTEGMSDADINRKINELRQYNGWATWCHSMYSYLSPEEYFDTHPEYFSMKNGKRIHTDHGIDAHLCLSNEDVYRIVHDKMAKMIEENPDKKYFDFSINDNSWVRGCECEQCKALDEAAGGTGMGSLLPFLNRLAADFPDVYICTLAYFHTLRPPTNIKCRENVVVKLCSMPGDQASSYKNPTNKNAREFHDRVVEWSRICDHIVIWDYTVDFAHLLLPFPNLAVQAENQQFYEEHNVEGIFHQSSREIGGELVNLRAYILSKLMWEGGKMDVAHEVSRYVYAYYGEAAPHVIRYLNTLHKNLADNSGSLGLYDSNVAHLNGYLSRENIENYEKIIDDAIESVKGDDEHMRHVEELVIGVHYAKMLLPNISDEMRAESLDIVNTLTAKHGITMTQEWQSLSDFNKNFESEINSIKRQVNMPLYISLGVIGSIVIITLIIGIILRRKVKA